MDSRYQKLAETLVEYSIEVEPGEKVLVEATEIPREFTTTLIRTIHEAGGMPVVRFGPDQACQAKEERRRVEVPRMRER